MRFRHSGYNSDRAQKLMSSSMSRYLSTLNISSKSMHTFLNLLLTDRQTDKREQRHLPPPLSEVIIVSSVYSDSKIPQQTKLVRV